MITEDTTNSILDIENPSIILHQVNTLGYGTSGLMNRIMKLYPSMFTEYHNLCGWFKDYKRQDEIFGTFQAIKFPNSKNILCNGFSQRFFTDTKYESIPEEWEKIVRKVISQIRQNQKESGILYEVHVPFKVGIGMKADEIDALKDILANYFTDSDIKLTYHI